jgi:hypothetical protein
LNPEFSNEQINPLICIAMFWLLFSVEELSGAPAGMKRDQQTDNELFRLGDK